MLSKIKELYWSAARRNPEALEGICSRLDRLETILRETQLSPVDRAIAAIAAQRSDGLFHHSYRHWRAIRITKILEIYGFDHFAGRKVLELGAGHGDIGAALAELGADVLCLDGRIENINYGRLKFRNLPNFRLEYCNLDGDFSHSGEFDLIINFGLLYHLEDLEGHLKRCFAMANDMVIETVVCDSTDPYKVIMVCENSDVNEEALGEKGSRPSPFYIERIAKENGFEVDRYFTSDLNSSAFIYDWEHRDDNRDGGWDLRRFWRMRRNG